MAITVDVFTKVVEASLKNESEKIEKTFGQTGQKAGEQFAKSLASQLSKNPELQKQFDKSADLLGKQRVAQEALNAAEAKGTASKGQLIKLNEALQKATRDADRAVSSLTDNFIKFGTHSTNALNDVNRAASGALNVLSNLTASTRFGGLTAQVANMASGFTAAGEAVGGLSASMLAAGGIAAGTVAVAFAAAAAGAVALTSEIYNLGKEFDNTFDSLQTKTGATGNVLDQLKSVVKDVAGQVPESLGTIGDLTAQVTQSMTLTTQQTEQLVVALGTLKHLGVEVNVHDLGMAFKALDVNQQDYVSSTEQVLKLSQSTGLSFDSVTSAIENNAGALKAFGFTFGEALTVIKEFEDVGLSPDKGLGALNKAFKALTEAGLEPTKANLQSVFNEIKGFIDSGQVDKANQELNDLFGARGQGLSWLPLIQEGKLNLDELANAADAPSTSIQGLANDTYDLSENFTMLGNDVKSALEPLSTELFNLLNEGLKGIGEWIQNNKPEIIGFFTGLTTQVVNFVQVLTGMLGTTLYSAGTILPDFLGGSDIKNAGQSLMDLSAKLEDMQNKLQTAGDKANDAAQKQRDMGGEASYAAGKIQMQADALDNLNSAFGRVGDQPIGGALGGGLLGPAAPGPFSIGGSGGAQKFAASGAGGRSFNQSGLQANTAQLENMIGAAFPAVKDIGGWRPPDGYNEHSSGQALDVMVPNWNTPQGVAYGNQIAQYALQSGQVDYVLWQQRQWNADGTSSAMSPRPGGPTANHMDHVHVHTRKQSGGSTGGMMKFGPGGSSGSTGGLGGAVGSAGMLNYGPDAGGSAGPLPPGTPSPIPGLKPGPVGSTFGYNEFGEPGYYRPDSDQIHIAERSKANADKAVTKAQERLGELQKDIADLEAQRTVLNADKTDKQIADKNNQIKDLQDQIADLKDNVSEADRRLSEAQRGRFTPAGAASSGRGGKGGLGQVGAPLADDFGISEGLPGIAKWATTFLANLAFAPMIGQLSAIAQASPYQGGSGLIGILGAQQMAANGGSLFPNIGPGPLGGGVVGPGTGTSDSIPAMLSNGEYVIPSSAVDNMGGMNAVDQRVRGYAAGGPVDQTDMPTQQPGTSGGGGFQGIGGLPMQAIMGAASGLDLLAPGAGQAAQIGIQLANRTAAYVGQLGAIGVGGLMETFLPHGSALADPSKSWLGKLVGGFSGARPALPNAAGQLQDPGKAAPGGQSQGPAGQPAPPQTPEQAAALKQQQDGKVTQPNQPMVKIDQMVNNTPDSGRTIAENIAYMQMVSHGSGGPR